MAGLKTYMGVKPPLVLTLVRLWMIYLLTGYDWMLFCESHSLGTQQLNEKTVKKHVYDKATVFCSILSNSHSFRDVIYASFLIDIIRQVIYNEKNT